MPAICRSRVRFRLLYRRSKYNYYFLPTPKASTFKASVAVIVTSPLTCTKSSNAKDQRKVPYSPCVGRLWSVNWPRTQRRNCVPSSTVAVRNNIINRTAYSVRQCPSLPEVRSSVRRRPFITSFFAVIYYGPERCPPAAVVAPAGGLRARTYQ